MLEQRRNETDETKYAKLVDQISAIRQSHSENNLKWLLSNLKFEAVDRNLTYDDYNRFLMEYSSDPERGKQLNLITMEEQFGKDADMTKIEACTDQFIP